jgi:hypothetical protein
MPRRLQIVDLIPGEFYWVLRSGIEEMEFYIYRPIYVEFLRFSRNDHPYFQTHLGPASSLATESLATPGWQGPALYPTSFFHYYEDLPLDKMKKLKNDIP